MDLRELRGFIILWGLNPLELILYNNDTKDVVMGFINQSHSRRRFGNSEYFSDEIFIHVYVPFHLWTEISKIAISDENMGARRDGQKGARAPFCCKVFYVLLVTAKDSADGLFMHYFHNLSSASGGFASRRGSGGHLSDWGSIRDPAGSSDP